MGFLAQHFIGQLHPAVEALDFEQLKWKLCQSSEAKMSKETCDFAEQEYKRFLTLKKLYPAVDLVPNELVDEFWHAHILDTMSYQRDCDNLFGYFLHHYPYFGIKGDDDYQSLVNAFDKTKQLYEKHFGSYPASLDNATRCEGHACHSPKPCACRTPPACK